MADYSTGSASSFADLLTAINTFLVANGWTATAGTGTIRMYQKSGATFSLQTDADGLYLSGGTGMSGGDLTGDPEFFVKIGSPQPAPMTFPVTYNLHAYDAPDEVYLVVSYGGDKHQHLNFGVSDIPGIGGTGAWFTGTMRNDYITDAPDAKVYASFGPNYLGTSVSGFNLGYFISGWYDSSYVHCALEGAAAWRTSGNEAIATPGNLMGQHHVAGLLNALPSQFNEAEVLLPIYARMRRTDDVATVVAVMRNARLLRMDNVTPGEVITYGSDQWRCYPLYAKDTVDRDGVPWSVGANHSGTIGVAIRYDGV